MCVQIGNRLFAELGMAHSRLRKGRRDGPGSLLYSPEKSLFQMGFRSEAFFGAVGWVNRQERSQERFGEIGQESSRWITGGGRLGEGRRRRRGGRRTGAARGKARHEFIVMPCSVSCRYPVGAGGGYQSGAKWRELPREFVCCFALSAKTFADWRSVLRRLRRRYGFATKYVLQDSIRLLRYRDGLRSRWTFSYGYSLYDCSGSCKDPGHRAFASFWERALWR